MTGYFLQAFIYLAAAVIAVPIAKRLGLGSVLGYLIAGVVTPTADTQNGDYLLIHYYLPIMLVPWCILPTVQGTS